MTPLKALREALAGWRKTKHPRFAALTQWASTRALSAAPRPLVGAGRKKADREAWGVLLTEKDLLDLPRLFTALRSMKSADAAECVLLLSKQNDPRVVDGVLSLLGDPPWRARGALPFFRACAKVLHDSGDPRARAGMDELASRYKSMVETTVGDEVTALLRRTVESMDQVKPGPLPASWEEKCAALEAEFESEHTATQRGATNRTSTRRSEEALLAAIYAAPDDDTPRLVFADTLAERGDVRGEFISLQLNRANGKASAEQLTRERELASDPKRRAAWSLPLSQGGTCHVARGFPDELLIEPRMFKNVIGLPSVRTLRAVSGFERELSLKQAKAFLTHENAANVKSVKALSLALLEELERVPWEELSLRFLPLATQLARMPALRALSLWGVTERPTEQTFAGMARLERLMLNGIDAAALAPLSGLRELHIAQWLEAVNWSSLLSGVPKLERLVLGSAVHAGQVEGLRVRSLTCRYAPQFAPHAVINAMPELEELRVVSGGSSVPTAVTQLFAAKNLRRLKFAAVDGFELIAPFTPRGVLELRTWNRIDAQVHAGPVSTLPEGCVTKVLVRPLHADPWGPGGPPPSQEAIASIRAAAKVPVELAWY